MSIKTKLLSFARLLKTFQEVQTQNGSLISDTEIIVGSEVFVADAEGNLIPAPTAVYEAGDVKYTVESGIVIAIETTVLEEPIQEIVEEFTEVEEVVETIETPTVEEVVEVAEEVVDEKEKIIEELKAENEALKSEIEELKKQLEEPQADAIEEQTTVFSKQDKTKRTKLEALSLAFEK